MRQISRPGGAGASVSVAARTVDTAMVLWMLLLTFLWGLNAISVRVLVEGMAPIMGAALRGLVALACLTVYGWVRGESMHYFSRAGFHGAMNGVIFALEFTLIYLGARHTNGGHLSLFINMAPFFVAVGAHYLLPGDRLTPLRVAGMSLALVGVAALFFDDLFVAGTGFWRGDLLVLGGALCWGSSTLYVKKWLAHSMSAFRLLHVQILVSTPLLFAVSLWVEPQPFHAATPLIWAQVVFQGMIVVFITYMIWLALLRRYPASAMQSFTFMSPVWGVVAGILILGETVTVVMALGIGCVGLGIFLINRPRS